ncbi:MAG: endonuclease/exonuclease/phosphatase family protein, partial [Flavisolibacter sp.]
MKKHLHAFLALLTMFCLSSASAQNFSVTYNFGSVTNTSGRTDPTPVPTATGVSFGSFIAEGTGLSANPNAGGRFSFTGQPLGATNGSDVFTGSLDPDKYYSVTITPQTYYSLDLSSIVFTLQRSGTGIRQYAVRSSVDGYTSNLPASIDPANANLTVVADNIFQVSDPTSTAQAGSKITLNATSFTNLSTPVTFRFYGFNAEASSGTFSIDNVQLNGTATISPTAPKLTINPTGVNFPVTPTSSTSAALTYTVQGENLTDQVNITSSAPFAISTDENGSYSTSISLTPAEVASPKTIYVRFSPTSTGTFNESITHTSTGAANVIVTTSGQGIDPANLSFDFNSCTNGGAPGAGFITYSVTGAQVWACTSFGRNSSNGVNINGYSGGPQENEDWLISPPLSIGSLNLPVLRFWSRGEFAGTSLQLLVSTNYSGMGDPNAATWTVLDANFPPLTNTWAMTDGINLSPYKSAPQVFIAFRYISSVEDGAARWTVDDVDITDRSMLLSVFPSSLSFGEASVGTFSPSNRLSLQAYGYGDLTVTAPSDFQISTDSLSGFTTTINITQADAEAGRILYARFAPTTKALTLQGSIRITGTSLDSNAVSLSGTSYPKEETFDAGTYNLSFFGSNPTNNPTPQKIATQLGNIETVLERLNLDIVGVQEVSSDVVFDSLVKRLPNHKGILSSRWSYSFEAPDPNFPPQKIGFIYDSTTAVLVEERVMFESRYDSVRNGFPEKLPSYPGGTPQSFWASGRLPYMATFNVTVEGASRLVRVVVIHAKSASDQSSYNRRVYDVQVLKDSLDAWYSNDHVIILGDYNDRLSGTIYGGSGATSPYKSFVDDNTDYAALTYPLDQAGRVSFIGGTGLIDHIIVTNELSSLYITGSTEIEDPRSYISGYSATTASDHLPLYSRFLFPQASPLPVTLIEFGAVPQGNKVKVAWITSSEVNNSHFVVERSGDGVTFSG